MYKGIAAAPGVAIGRALIHRHHELTVDELNIAQEAVQEEVSKFSRAVERSRAEVVNLRERAIAAIGSEQAEIFDAHLALLSDPILISEVVALIKEKHFTAEASVSQAMNKYIDLLNGTEDKYMQERSVDIEDVGKRILHNLVGGPSLAFPNPQEPRIIIAKDLTPSETVQLDPAKILGLVTVVGGATSHTAIMARAMEIPSVMGIGSVLDTINDGDLVIVDGDQGLVLVNPNSAFQLEYQHRLDVYQKEKEEWSKGADLKSVTTDGVAVTLLANIATTQEAQVVLTRGAEGVGLFRTEFLYLGKKIFPSEEEQLEIYRRLIQTLQGKGAVIRTLDVGGDKALPYVTWPDEINPALGLRGIRWTLKKSEVLKTQLRGILRASNYGPVSILFPMISSMEEWHQTLEVLEQAKMELRQEGKGFAADIPLGVMIEVPSAALIAPFLATEVDFMSIGTNDLTQYALAVDRANQEVSQLYQPLHPAVLRLIDIVVQAAHGQHKKVSVCGELAGNPQAAVVLLGLGVDQLSMTPRALYRVKAKISQVAFSQAVDIANTVKTLSTYEKIQALLDQHL